MGRSRIEGQVNGIGYKALPSQEKFHGSEARFKGFSGPVGSGKSKALCHEAFRLCIENQGRLGLLGAPTYPMLQAVVQPTLLEILEENGIKFEHNKSESLLVMPDIRSRILFRPTDEFDRLRGTNLAWFGVDELTYTKQDAWLQLEARLRDPKAKRLCGFAVWTPKGYDWVYQRFLVDDMPDYETIVATPAENKYLPDGYYEHLKSSYDETFYKQEVLGEYLNLAGNRVFGSFTRADHVRPLQRDSSPVLWSLDFNVNPMCSVIVQRAGQTLRVLDEIYIKHGSTIQACEEFLKRMSGHGSEIYIYGDASGHNRKTTGPTDFDMVQDFMAARSKVKVKLKLVRVNPCVNTRIMLTNKMLRNAAGDVELYVDPKCKELIQDFEQISYKEDHYEVDKERDRNRTHLSDALGYLLWYDYTHPVTGEQNHPIRFN